MTESEGQRRPGYRFVLMFLFAAVTAAVTSVSARLVADVSQWWRPGGAGYLAATAVMLVLSGVLINSLPRVLGDLRRWEGSAAAFAKQFVDVLGGGRKRAGIVVTVVVLGLGSYFLLPSADGLEPGELVIMAAEDLSPDDPRRTLLGQWNATHPANPAKIVNAVGETDEQYEHMVNDAKPDGKHEADVYLLDVVWMAQFVDEGYIRELDRSRLGAVDLDDFVDKVLRTGEREGQDGKLWALPLNTDVGLVYYRTDIPTPVEPATWDDHSGITARTAPMAVHAFQLSGEMATITSLEAIWAEGGVVVQDDGRISPTTDGDRARFADKDNAGLRKLNTATRDPALAPGDPGPGDTNAGDAVNQFVEGRAQYMRNWAVAHEQLTDRQRELDENGITFRVAAPPTPSVLGGQNLAISAHNEDKPRAAQALIEFMTSAQSQLILSEIGGFAPARDSVYELLKGEQFSSVRNALRDARPRPAIPCYTRWSKDFRDGVRDVVGPDDEVSDEVAEKLTGACQG
ncbi:extracellular solute-binding protein [Saccharothrix lopnurensis]|uniref:Extracellular solute-binding protein n=1 Tax=Saccharothrix lopnurensis TaxID=1670621 RepID=A0ABW1P684_9PSEU